jgi:hypothetical protein
MVERINVTGIVMQDVPTPITITTFYSGADKPEEIYPKNEGTPVFRDMLFSNIIARGATNAGSIVGLKEQPIENITFSNLHIEAQKTFGITNASGIVFLDSVIDTAKGPALTLKNTTGIEYERLRTRAPHKDTPLVQTEAPSDKRSGPASGQ